MQEKNQQPDVSTDTERRPSWSSIPVLILYVIAAALIPYVGAATGVILMAGILCFCVWTTLSKSEYEKLRISYPAYTRNEYILNSLFYLVFMPWIFIFLLGGVIKILD